jgi:hypothetical protein
MKEESPAGATPAQSKPKEMFCPKCGHAQKNRVACERCGLVFSKFSPDSMPADPERAASLWEEIKDSQDAKRHESFVSLCVKENRLDYAARKYRMLGYEKEKGDFSKRMLSRLAQLGQARLLSVLAPTTRRVHRKWRSRMFLSLALLVVLGVITYLFFDAPKSVLPWPRGR